METYIESLRDLCQHRDLSGLILKLKDLIPDYNPGDHLLSRALSAGTVPHPAGTTPVQYSFGKLLKDPNSAPIRQA